MKALLLEDDPTLSKEVKRLLESKLIHCDAVYDGETFFRQQSLEDYTIYLLDINVPLRNGIEVCKKIRESDTQSSILMLTAYGDISDKSDAYKAGADDYLVKPFHFEELYLRIQSLHKRKGQTALTEKNIVIGDLEIYVQEKKVKRKDDWIALSPKEYQLLLLLANAGGRTVSKQTIAEKVWDIQFDSNLNTIEVYINFLRKKIDKNYDEKLIHTRAGYGYFLKASNMQ